MAAKFTDYYELLGIPRTATLEEIKQAYRKLARAHHPDLHPEKDKETHTRRMQEINEAYAVLSSPENRAKYDQFGEHWKEGPPPGPQPGAEGAGGFRSGRFTGAEAEAFSDFFQNMFRQGRSEAGYDQFYPSELDVEAELELTLEEAVRGVDKSFSLVTTGLCPNCHGTGRTGKTLCPVCGGVGEIRRPRSVTAKIPAGLLEGARIRLKGQGNEGAGRRGDLYLTIHLAPDTRFTVDGKNLESEVMIRPWQAALGSEISVPTLDGSLRVRVPKSTHAGKRLRLAGRGLGKPGARGDLFLRIGIDIPEGISSREEALYKQLEELSRG